MLIAWLRRTLFKSESRALGLRLRGFLRAKYDSALTTDNSRRHWALADGLSADAANGPDVRRILRNRARYEVANNSYAGGIKLSLTRIDSPNCGGAENR